MMVSKEKHESMKPEESLCWDGGETRLQLVARGQKRGLIMEGGVLTGDTRLPEF